MTLNLPSRASSWIDTAFRYFYHTLILAVVIIVLLPLTMLILLTEPKERRR